MDSTDPVPFLDLKQCHCREVVGTGADGLALFCGRTKSGTTSYCNYHRSVNLVMVARADRPKRQKVWDF